MGMALTRLPLVAFNAQLASGTASYRSAGISAYIVNLLRSLSRQAVEWRSIVFWGAEQFPADVPLPFRRSSLPTYHPLVRIFWEQVLLPLALQRLHAALLHAPAFVGPLASPCPQVITIHDLSFLRYPQFFRRSNRLYLRWMTGIACRRAAGVIAVSQFTAREVTDLLGVPSERVHTIYHGVESRFQPLSIRIGCPFPPGARAAERFILHLGTLEPRKKLLTLVRAFARLHESEVHLVLAGGKGWFYEDIFAEVERLGLQDRVHFPGYVSAESKYFGIMQQRPSPILSHYGDSGCRFWRRWLAASRR
jgi:glycosyltransferase involved in cell wall biosynthesis